MIATLTQYFSYVATSKTDWWMFGATIFGGLCSGGAVLWVWFAQKKIMKKQTELQKQQLINDRRTALTRFSGNVGILINAYVEYVYDLQRYFLNLGWQLPNEHRQIIIEKTMQLRSVKEGILSEMGVLQTFDQNRIITYPKLVEVAVGISNAYSFLLNILDTHSFEYYQSIEVPGHREQNFAGILLYAQNKRRDIFSMTWDACNMNQYSYRTCCQILTSGMRNTEDRATILDCVKTIEKTINHKGLSESIDIVEAYGAELFSDSKIYDLIEKVINDTPNIEV